MNRLGRLLVISPLIFAVVVSTTGYSDQSRVGASALPTTNHSKLVTRVFSMVRSNPIRIQIPSIGVDSNLMKLGLLKDGSLQVPPSAFPAGWYSGSPTPGEMGPSIIAGHVDWNGPGVFYRLNRMQLGDQIKVGRADGTIATFTVTRIAGFLKSKFPTNAVYGDLNYPGLRLITCGDYDFKTHKYLRDTVVFADLVS
jgi:LPXTG-site transpeptidase (sortase) family protein